MGNNDKKKAFTTLYDFNQNKMIPVANPEYDVARYGDEGNSDYAVVRNQTPYMLQSQWTAQRPMDIQRVNLKTGERTNLGTKVYGANGMSPTGNYVLPALSFCKTLHDDSVSHNRNTPFQKQDVFAPDV